MPRVARQPARLAGCQSTNHTVCRGSKSDLWTCLQCKRQMCLEEGAADDQPDVCDTCASLVDLPMHHRATMRAIDVTIGSPATVSVGSDSYPYTVVDMRRGRDGIVKAITVQSDRSISLNLHLVNREGRTKTFTRRSDGRFREKGERGGCQLSLGYREHNLDPSF